MSVEVRARVLAGRDESVSAARHWIRKTLADFGCPAAEDCEACLSELVTNAVTHSLSRERGGKVRIRLVIALGAWVRIDVKDDGPLTWPAPVPPQGPPPQDAEGGRGLLMVGALAETVGQNPRIGLYWCRVKWGTEAPAPVPGQGSLFDLLPAEAGDAR